MSSTHTRERLVATVTSAAIGLAVGFGLSMAAFVFTGWRQQGETGDVAIGPLTVGRVEATLDGSTTSVSSAITWTALLLVITFAALGWWMSGRRVDAG